MLELTILLRENIDKEDYLYAPFDDEPATDERCRKAVLLVAKPIEDYLRFKHGDNHSWKHRNRRDGITDSMLEPTYLTIYKYQEESYKYVEDHSDVIAAVVRYLYITDEVINILLDKNSYITRFAFDNPEFMRSPVVDYNSSLQGAYDSDCCAIRGLDMVEAQIQSIGNEFYDVGLPNSIDFPDFIYKRSLKELDFDPNRKDRYFCDETERLAREIWS